MTDKEFDKLWTSCEWRQEIDKLRAIVEAVAPIIKRNAELEAELTRLREQPFVGRVVHGLLVWDVEPKELEGKFLYAEPKPAQIPAELDKMKGTS